MRVTLQYFDGCPHWRTAEDRVREAIERLGRADVVVVHQRVRSAEQAEELSFRGSPTVLVDGRDPFADPQAPVGLACRVYGTATGASGAPTVQQLLDALAA